MGRDRGGGTKAAQKSGKQPSSTPTHQQAAAAPPAHPPVWVTWVPGVLYITENVWDKRVPASVVKQFRPVTEAPAGDGRCTLARPGRITDPAHPAFGQCGLFAAKKLAPGTHVCDYRGAVTLVEHESKTSDYTLAFVEEGAVRLTLDAEKCGNEARFINDFRGTGGKANVRFAARTDARGVRHMGVYVLPGGAGVAKGAELLLSYGKGFWLARGLLRQQEADAEVEELAQAAAALRVEDGDASQQP